ncbi:MAG: RluA family pseudouridine synthase, partial [Clostridia bacterium]|nr:RluA family pseudouridine synthase [Clostridia bacterium]
MIKLEAYDNYARLDVFVASNCDLTRSRAQKLIADGFTTLNGNVCTKPSVAVKEGDEVVVTLPPAVQLNVEPQDIPLDIVWQDEVMAVVNKQQGLTVHPANNQFSDTLVNALLFHVKDLSGINGVLRPGIVHRLDKDTSGLLLVAKTDLAHQSLASQIQSKSCRRIYVALVEGVIKQDGGIVDMPIGRSKTDRKKMDIDKNGRSATTHYTVLQRYRSNTLVQFELKTGRTHQIRVHTKHLGHPVVGDKVYGYKNQRFS